MSSLSHSEVVLLALLSERRAHAYELVQRIRSMKLEQWARIRESTLYAALRRMEDRGLIRGRQGAGGRAKTKRTYASTPGGRARLKELIVEGLASPDPIYSDRLLAAVFATAFGQRIALRQAADSLRVRKAHLSEALRRPRLSKQGRVIIEFYIGLADLHLRAVRSLEAVGASARRASMSALSTTHRSG